MRKRQPDDPILGLNALCVGDFWAWAYSDILSNRNRAVFAEFLVGAALGVLDAPRVEWDAVDLRYRGKTIEVKSAAFVQSWASLRPSKITFDIAEKLGWDSLTNLNQTTAIRMADCYVFCLYPEQNPAAADIIDVPAWQFFVVPTVRLAAAFGPQKSASLSKIRALCPVPVCFGDLRAVIDEAMLGLPVDVEKTACYDAD